jgi:hypothetical protein
MPFHGRKFEVRMCSFNQVAFWRFAPRSPSLGCHDGRVDVYVHEVHRLPVRSWTAPKANCARVALGASPARLMVAPATYEIITVQQPRLLQSTSTARTATYTSVGRLRRRRLPTRTSPTSSRSRVATATRTAMMVDPSSIDMCADGDGCPPRRR